jgi:hypothetical protein
VVRHSRYAAALLDEIVGWCSAAVTVIRRRGPVLSLALVLILPGLPPGAAAQEPLRWCREKRTDDTLRVIPLSLVPAATRLFRLAMPSAQIQRTTVFRCAGGRTLLCTSGANLPCGKANADRRLAGAEAWCRDHPHADMIPAFATGSDTVYRWRCAGSTPEIVAQVEKIDARGFVARYWKALH